MFDATIMNILSNIWPMLVIITVILTSYRLVSITRNKEKFVFYHEVLKLAFVIYIMCLFYVVTFQDVSWSTSNFIPFKEMFRYQLGGKLFIKNVVGNMLMFLPYGFLISYFLKITQKRTIICLSFIISLTIEITQLLIGRVFDVDDILLNMLGGLIGYYSYKLLYKIKEKLPIFLKNQIFYNMIVIIFIMFIIWYLYKMMWLGV